MDEPTEEKITENQDVMYYENLSSTNVTVEEEAIIKKYVTDIRSSSAVHQEVVDSLVEFLSQRFEADGTLL